MCQGDPRSAAIIDRSRVEIKQARRVRPTSRSQSPRPRSRVDAVQHRQRDLDRVGVTILLVALCGAAKRSADACFERTGQNDTRKQHGVPLSSVAIISTMRFQTSCCQHWRSRGQPFMRKPATQSHENGAMNMCLSRPSVPPPPPPPQLPPERAAQARPDGGAVRSAAERRATERMGARPSGSGPIGSGSGAMSTILTSPQGALSMAATDRKTLLGQ